MKDQSQTVRESKRRLETTQNTVSIPVLRRKERDPLALSTASFTDSKENTVTNYRDSLLTSAAFLSSYY